MPSFCGDVSAGEPRGELFPDFERVAEGCCEIFGGGLSFLPMKAFGKSMHACFLDFTDECRPTILKGEKFHVEHGMSSPFSAAALHHFVPRGTAVWLPS